MRIEGEGSPIGRAEICALRRTAVGGTEGEGLQEEGLRGRDCRGREVTTLMLITSVLMDW